MTEDGWQKGFPLELVRKGRTRFLIRGTHDPESEAVPVVVSPREGSMTDHEKVVSHAAVGLSLSLAYFVSADGTQFEERGAWELEGCLWKLNE